LRDNVEAIKRIFVDSPFGYKVPLGQVAQIVRVPGPAKIASENTLLYVRVFVDVDTEVTGIIDFVKEADRVVREKVNFPPGYFITWSGQYEYEIQSRKRLMIVVPICIAAIFILLYMKFKSLSSVAVEAGIVMVEYLLQTSKAENTDKSLKEVIADAALLRIRPIVMTTATTIFALMAVMFSTGTGSEVMKPIAVPTVGGILTATLTNLLLVPVLFNWIYKERHANEISKDG